MKTVPKKYHFVAVNPKPCSSAEAEKHLRAFAESFIEKDHRARWIHITIENPKKAEFELSKFERYHDPAHCKMMTNVDAFPLSLAESHGNKLGIYFDGTEAASYMTVAEAAALQENG